MYHFDIDKRDLVPRFAASFEIFLTEGIENDLVHFDLSACLKYVSSKTDPKISPCLISFPAKGKSVRTQKGTSLKFLFRQRVYK